MTDLKKIAGMLVAAVSFVLAAAPSELLKYTPNDCTKIIRLDCSVLTRIPEMQRALNEQTDEFIPGGVKAEQLVFKEVVVCDNGKSEDWVFVKVPENYDPVSALRQSGVLCQELKSEKLPADVKLWELSAENESIKLASCKLAPDVLMCGSEGDVAKYFAKAQPVTPNSELLALLDSAKDDDLAMVMAVPAVISAGNSKEKMVLSGSFIDGGSMRFRATIKTGAPARSAWYQLMMPQSVAVLMGVLFPEEPELALDVLSRIKTKKTGDLVVSEIELPAEIARKFIIRIAEIAASGVF